MGYEISELIVSPADWMTSPPVLTITDNKCVFLNLEGDVEEETWGYQDNRH